LKLIEGNVDTEPKEGPDMSDGSSLVFSDVGTALDPGGFELTEGEVGARLELGLAKPDGS
jgi:hypothetical protein